MAQHAESIACQEHQAAEAAEHHLQKVITAYHSQHLKSGMEGKKPLSAWEYAATCEVSYTTFM